jgi:excisionase family DNA binding protein
MGRPAKPLQQHVRDATFRARQHGHLLAGSELEQWPALAELQRQYGKLSGEGDRYAIGLEFERLVSRAHAGAASAAKCDAELRAQVPATPHRGSAGQATSRDRTPTVRRLAYSPSEAAEALGVSRDFLDEHIAHELRIVRRGRRKLIAVRELERWLSEQATFTVERTA